ncbi:hypothetical protein [Sphingomonas astaxanthinifaciens]|uniref:hypothetical protein n=1 Tax=Sphingomonas astaxanthinifaciens TaxID=407019 RepID=UPI0012EBB5F3|nr:hypothetical protein [Sphingomonas astaxanthinifaciens]
MTGALAGVLASLPALFLALLSAGAGHGDYGFARALFPVPMLLTLIQGDSLGRISLAASLLQFPIYGLVLADAFARRRMLWAALLVIGHAAAAIPCFAGTVPNFS